MLTFFFIMWIVATYAGSMLEVSYTDCTKSNAKGKLNKVIFEPAKPEINKNFTYDDYSAYL